MRSNDPREVEESRQSSSQNPMVKIMVESMPLINDTIGDKYDFRQTMFSVAQVRNDVGGDGVGTMADATQVWI